MAIILLPAGLLLLYILSRRLGYGIKVSLMNMAVIWQVLVVILTEALSLTGWVSKNGLTAGWLIIDLGLALACSVVPKIIQSKETAVDAENADGLKWPDYILLTGMGSIALISALITVVAPPNHGDVMSYHLPRIVMWLQNGSVSFYPTNDGRQLSQPPGAEYAVMQFHALASSDRFDGIVAWAGFVLVALVASIIVEKLGGSLRLQILAAAFCLTMPQSVLIASSGKNDCVVAFFIAAFVCYLIAFGIDRDRNLLLLAGAALGVALFTKGTAFFFTPPLLAAIVLKWPKSLWREATKQLAIAAAIVVLINAAQWGRNAMLYKSPLGPGNEWGLKFANDSIGPRTAYANILKNIAVHSRTPIRALNYRIEKLITWMVSISGADLNDPGSNWGRGKFKFPDRPASDTYAGNPWHLSLIFLTILLIIFARDRKELPWELSLGLIVAFIFFCSVLRWQGGIARFHIPLFVLWAAPVVMVAAGKLSSRLVTAVMIVLLVPALWWGVSLPRQSILPGRMNNIFTSSRMDLYFAHKPDLSESYLKAVEAVKASDCKKIGIVSELDEFEYPIIAGLGGETGALNYQYAHVLHPSKKYASRYPQTKVCAIICPICWDDWVKEYSQSTDRSLQFDKVYVFFSDQGILP